MKKIKIGIITSSRADYGLLKPLITEFYKEKNYNVCVIVTGSHLSKKYGNTYKEILEDGIKIDEKIKIYDDTKTDSSVTDLISIGVKRFSDGLEKIKPDFIFLLGDRYEIYSAAIAAYFKQIPICHLCGGETTIGAFDEGIRHSITKFSYFHFASTEKYRKRIIQLGEAPERVFNVGSLAIDAIKNTNLLSKADLEKELHFKFGEYNIMVTYHPVTLENNEKTTEIIPLLLSLKNEIDKKDAKIIFTLPNADPQNEMIRKKIKEFKSQNIQNVEVYDSLGSLRYLSAIKEVNYVIGNSSSGVIEVPFFRKPTINIGNRQKGRLMPVSVVNTEMDYLKINEKIEYINSVDFRNIQDNMPQIFGNGCAANKIKMLFETNKNNVNLQKVFFDLD